MQLREEKLNIIARAYTGREAAIRKQIRNSGEGQICMAVRNGCLRAVPHPGKLASEGKV